MKKYAFLIAGILCLIASFIWMFMSQKSTGLFLLLAALSGALLVEGAHRIKGDHNKQK